MQNGDITTALDGTLLVRILEPLRQLGLYLGS